MYPHERTLVKKLADMPFALIGVNSDNDLDSIRETIKEENISWRSFWNGEEGTRGPISQAWNVKGWPTIYVLDADGKIHYKGHGGPEIDETIAKLLGEMGHEVDLSEDHDDEEKAEEAEGA
jgi:hypothetical protein